jgi:hypothetical protein
MTKPEGRKKPETRNRNLGSQNQPSKKETAKHAKYANSYLPFLIFAYLA